MPTTLTSATTLTKVALTKITLSIRDFCKVAGISRSRTYEEIKAGRLRILKCGRRTLITPEAVEGWIKTLRGPQSQ